MKDMFIMDAHTKPYTWPVEQKIVEAKKERKKRGNMLTTRRGIREFVAPLFRQNPIEKSDFLIKEMDKYGIEKAVVQSSVLYAPNDFIAGLVNKHKDRLVGFGRWLPGSSPDETAEEVERAIRELGLRGIGEWAFLEFYPIPPHEIHLRREFTVPMNAIARLGVPVLFHTGWEPLAFPLRYGDPLIVDDIANIYPEVPIIMGHAAKIEPYFHDMALLVARKHDNVYLELSQQPSANIENMVKKIGADRCLFGTNWWPPGHSAWKPSVFRRSLDAVLKAKIRNDEKELIFGKNLLELLKI